MFSRMDDVKYDINILITYEINPLHSTIHYAQFTILIPILNETNK